MILGIVRFGKDDFILLNCVVDWIKFCLVSDYVLILILIFCVIGKDILMEKCLEMKLVESFFNCFFDDLN